MALITLVEAAARIGTSRETIDQWVRSGVLCVTPAPQPNGIVGGALSTVQPEPFVDEDELFDKADSMGWFLLSAENWDGAESE